jgi:AcrR family transcriptional regulator
MATTSPKTPRQRIPAAERRDALIEAAVHEFAQSGYHGTPVDRIARSVGVAQPYVFSLFGSKRELFIAAVHRCFETVTALLTATAATYDPSAVPEDMTILPWMGGAYVEKVKTDRDLFMLQLQAFAACDDEVIQAAVRADYAQLIRDVEKIAPEADQEQLDNFCRYGAWININAAMGIEDVTYGCEWVRDEPEPAQA